MSILIFLDHIWVVGSADPHSFLFFFISKSWAERSLLKVQSSSNTYVVRWLHGKQVN